MWTVRGAALAALLYSFGPAQAQEPPPQPPPSAPAPAREVEPEAVPAEVPPAPPRRDNFGINSGFGGGGAGMGGGFGGLGGGGGSGGPGYSATWYPSRPVSGRGTDLGLVRQNLSLAVPVWRDGGDVVALTGGIRNTLFSTRAVLPDSGRPFPDDLWNVSVGLNYVHKFDNGWSAGGVVSVGSASDKPFNSVNEMTANVVAFARAPARNDRDAWLLGVAYSPTGNLNFPLPLLAYVWNPSDRLQVNIGLPFSVAWRPVDDLILTLSYTPLANVNARATYRLAERVSVYGGFEWLNEAYFLADRADRNDRFLGYEKRLITGARWNVWEHGTAEVSGGYAFDRYYGIGQNSIGNLRDRVDVAPGAFLGASFRVRF